MMVTGSPGDDGEMDSPADVLMESLHLGPLVKTVVDVKGSPVEDKVDAYLTLTEWVLAPVLATVLAPVLVPVLAPDHPFIALAIHIVAIHKIICNLFNVRYE